MDATDHSPSDLQTPPAASRPRRWRRYARWAVILLLAGILCGAYLIKDHVRTLQSLRRVPGTNAYVIDYYADYNMDEIRSHGMDVNHVESGLIDVFFPDAIAWIAAGAKDWYLEEDVETIATHVDRCSTAVLRTPTGRVFFGRNFDWMHDACLIVRIHRDDSLVSVSVIDLHYLNLDRDDLMEINLIERIPLLFAPYYLQDGMNRHGVAVSDMSVDGVKAPYDPAKPEILHATAMRLILDYARTTDEAIDIFRQYNVHFGATTGHLMIADASGKSAVVEFIDGKMEVTPAKDNWQVCTNQQIFKASEEQCDDLCQRYRTASDQLAKASGATDIDDIMDVMESVSKKNWTMWSSVYDLTSRKFRIAYRQHFDNPYDDSLFEPN